MVFEKKINPQEVSYEDEEYKVNYSAERGVFTKNQYSAAKEKVKEIQVIGKNLPIQIMASVDDRIHLTFYNEKDWYYNLRLERSRLRLEVVEHHCWREHMFTGKKSTFNIGIMIELPQQFAGTLNVHNSNSKIDMSGMRVSGDVFLDTQNSHISVISCETETMELSTSNSSITVKDTAVEKNMKLITSNSAIMVEKIAGRNISLETCNGKISGTICGESEEYEVTSHTSNGSNNLPEHWGKGEKKLSARTSNSSIQIEFIGK